VIDEKRASDYAKIIQSLHAKWTPHQGQITIGKALFRDEKKNLFINAGRKFGKTELAIYILWRWALTHPQSNCYYITPSLKQGREIVWADPRILTLGDHSHIKKINNFEMRLIFNNDSFIKIDGSENYQAHRGTRPSIVIFEEFKDHNPEFRNVMKPNLAVYNAPEIFIGTPDDRESHYYQVMREHQNDPNKFYFEASTYTNPIIPRKFIEDERKRLYDIGEGDVFEREYMAKPVLGTASKIYPMIDKSYIVSHETLLQEIEKDKHKLEWYIAADPAGASTFGVLFMALNPYTKTWYALDEIYERDQLEMTVVKIGQRIQDIKKSLWHREWTQIYDEAATWFSNEMIQHYGEHYFPTQKSMHNKENGLTLIKDVLFQRKLLISSKCKYLYWEMDNYYKDKNGNIPKKNDHLGSDCLRYILGFANYSLHETQEPKIEEEEIWLDQHRSLRSKQPSSEWETF